MARWRTTSGEEKRKYALAEHLGLLEELQEKGWAGLPAKETGRIGGMLHRSKKQ